jgi:hypothetical protein
MRLCVRQVGVGRRICILASAIGSALVHAAITPTVPLSEVGWVG